MKRGWAREEARISQKVLGIAYVIHDSSGRPNLVI